jgi:hypothetical protein
MQTSVPLADWSKPSTSFQEAIETRSSTVCGVIVNRNHDDPNHDVFSDSNYDVPNRFTLNKVLHDEGSRNRTPLRRRITMEKYQCDPTPGECIAVSFKSTKRRQNGRLMTRSNGAQILSVKFKLFDSRAFQSAVLSHFEHFEKRGSQKV